MQLFSMARKALIAVLVYEISINSLPADSFQWKIC